MTNLAQPITTSKSENSQMLLQRTVKPRTASLMTTGTSDLLQVGPTVPPPIITVSYDSTANRVDFTQQGDPNTYSGIQWSPSAAYALVINFVLDPTISELFPKSPSFWFSDKYQTTVDNVTTTNQLCCVAAVPGHYHFDAHPTNATMLDPKIVVTPA